MRKKRRERERESEYVRSRRETPCIVCSAAARTPTSVNTDTLLPCLSVICDFRSPPSITFVSPNARTSSVVRIVARAVPLVSDKSALCGSRGSCGVGDERQKEMLCGFKVKELIAYNTLPQNGHHSRFSFTEPTVSGLIW